ncbi:hypothetical protein POSPLADRAFT_1040907 [Postia placenta MAD-698-R-SB12]|uniref:Uncharacterized protein n=1 Tax=Postia placenta MAD-698-R-SB12 TaxID=670580 RepID=A0A1X6MS27_9APHY|nr:hypothetical protein POSPLADRAFT_1040907 [Postia placenta MAD-698-R-SB12]OSX59178.1 hypothetical protein POSPLADRAFT_1040907 [Postia placenta MAD-698-R-SB12]
MTSSSSFWFPAFSSHRAFFSITARKLPPASLSLHHAIITPQTYLWTCIASFHDYQHTSYFLYDTPPLLSCQSRSGVGDSPMLIYLLPVWVLVLVYALRVSHGPRCNCTHTFALTEML